MPALCKWKIRENLDHHTEWFLTVVIKQTAITERTGFSSRKYTTGRKAKLTAVGVRENTDFHKMEKINGRKVGKYFSVNTNSCYMLVRHAKNHRLIFPFLEKAAFYMWFQCYICWKYAK